MNILKAFPKIIVKKLMEESIPKIFSVHTSLGTIEKEYSPFTNHRLYR